MLENITAIRSVPKFTCNRMVVLHHQNEVFRLVW